ncbi:MAG TPA: hypothetical protein VGN00_14155 [Puia sp.]|jgi:hypothetical protein
MEQNKQMMEEEALDFFSELYGGMHHVPGYKVHEWGDGSMVKHDAGEMATYDHNMLTRLVLMAHDNCYRVSISNHGPKCLKICVWKRKGREGSLFERHPTIEQAIEKHRDASNPINSYRKSPSLTPNK